MLRALREQGNLNGKDNSFLGNQLAKYLGYDFPDETVDNTSLLYGVSPFKPNLSYTTPLSNQLSNTIVK